jgi:hypothetical protein
MDAQWPFLRATHFIMTPGQAMALFAVGLEVPQRGSIQRAAMKAGIPPRIIDEAEWREGESESDLQEMSHAIVSCTPRQWWRSACNMYEEPGLTVWFAAHEIVREVAPDSQSWRLRRPCGAAALMRSDVYFRKVISCVRRAWGDSPMAMQTLPQVCQELEHRVYAGTLHAELLPFLVAARCGIAELCIVGYDEELDPLIRRRQSMKAPRDRAGMAPLHAIECEGSPVGSDCLVRPAGTADPASSSLSRIPRQGHFVDNGHAD